MKQYVWDERNSTLEGNTSSPFTTRSFTVTAVLRTEVESGQVSRKGPQISSQTCKYQLSFLWFRYAYSTSHSPIRIQNGGRRTPKFRADKKKSMYLTDTLKPLPKRKAPISAFWRLMAATDKHFFVLYKNHPSIRRFVRTECKLNWGKNKRIESMLQFPFWVCHLPSIWCNKRPE